MSKEGLVEPPRAEPEPHEAAAWILLKELRKIEQGGGSRTFKDRQWLLKVLGFLDTLVPDARAEKLTKRGLQMALDLQDQLQRKAAVARGGAPILAPHDAGVRTYALASVDALTLTGWAVQDARNLVASILEDAGVRGRPRRGVKGPVKKGTLRDWAEWIERQPKIHEEAILVADARRHRQVVTDQLVAAIKEGNDPEEVVRAGMELALDHYRPEQETE